MDVKTCKKCNQQKPVDRFGTFKSRTGKHRPRGTCLDCRALYHQKNADKLKAYRVDYNKKNRSKKRQRDTECRDVARAYVDEVKARTPCADCGHHFPPVCMDFDHVRGPNVNGVANLVGSSYKLDLIKMEIAKCEVVCACCHRLRTQARKQNLAPNIKKRA